MVNYHGQMNEWLDDSQAISKTFCRASSDGIGAASTDRYCAKDGKETGFGDQGAQENLRKIVSRFQDFLEDDEAGIDGVDDVDDGSDDGDESREASDDGKDLKR